MRQKTFFNFKNFFTFRQLVPITMEHPLFKDYMAEFDIYLSELGKPVEKHITFYTSGPRALRIAAAFLNRADSQTFHPENREGVALIIGAVPAECAESHPPVESNGRGVLLIDIDILHIQF